MPGTQNIRIVDVASVAAFYREGLVFGIVPLQEVIAWADRRILDEAQPAPAVLDLSLVRDRDALQAISLLSELAPTGDHGFMSHDVARGLLDRLRGDFVAGRRDLLDTIRTAVRLRSKLPVEDSLWAELIGLEDDRDLVLGRIAGDIPTLDKNTREWIGQFDGDADRFVRRGA